MKTLKLTSAALAFTLTLSAPMVFAQDQTNEQERKEAHAQAKVDEKAAKEDAKLDHGQQKKADKAQAKASHQTHKALNDDGTKKAARKQDKANREQDKADAQQR